MAIRSLQNLWLAACLALGLAPAGAAFASGGIVNNSASPHAQVRSVGLDEVRWTEGFWVRQFEACRDRILG